MQQQDLSTDCQLRFVIGLPYRLLKLMATKLGWVFLLTFRSFWAVVSSVARYVGIPRLHLRRVLKKFLDYNFNILDYKYVYLNFNLLQALSYT